MEVCARRAPKCLLETLFALCSFYFLVLNEQRDSKIWPLIVEGQWNIHSHSSSFQSLMNYHLLPFNHNFSQKLFLPLVSEGTAEARCAAYIKLQECNRSNRTTQQPQ